MNSLTLSQDEIIRRTKRALAIESNVCTDPVVIRQVLAEMHLDDLQTSNKALRRFLDRAGSEPLSLDKHIAVITESLEADYPMIAEFLEAALINGWLGPSRALTWSLNFGLVLNALTQAMVTDLCAAEEISQHVTSVREEMGIRRRGALRVFLQSWRATGRMFLAGKLVSTDPALTFFLFRRRNGLSDPDTLQRAYREGQLSYPEYKALLVSRHEAHRRDGLLINILEAGVTEYRAGYEDNAFCAHVLMTYLKENPSAPDERGLKTPILAEWIHLYESWNGAFLMGDVDDLQLTLPKLFLPSVLAAGDEDYLEVRTYSLWLTTNTLLFRRIDGCIRRRRTPVYQFAASVWGNINRRYADDFAHRHLQCGREELHADFRRQFRLPWIGFLVFFLKSLLDR